MKRFGALDKKYRYIKRGCPETIEKIENVLFSFNSKDTGTHQKRIAKQQRMTKAWEAG